MDQVLGLEGNDSHSDLISRNGIELAEIDCPFKGEMQMVFSVESSSK
jgi:hypothetical protein